MNPEKLIDLVVTIFFLVIDSLELLIRGILFPLLVLTNEALKPSYHALLSDLPFPKEVADFLVNLSPLALFFESIIVTYLFFFLWLAFCTRNDEQYESYIDGGAKGAETTSAPMLAGQEKSRCDCPACTTPSRLSAQTDYINSSELIEMKQPSSEKGADSFPKGKGRCSRFPVTAKMSSGTSSMSQPLCVRAGRGVTEASNGRKLSEEIHPILNGLLHSQPVLLRRTQGERSTQWAASPKDRLGMKHPKVKRGEEERYNYRIRETLLQELEKEGAPSSLMGCDIKDVTGGKGGESCNGASEEMLEQLTPFQRFLLDIAKREENKVHMGEKETPLKELLGEIDRFVSDQRRKNWGEGYLSANLSPAEIDKIILKRAKERMEALSEEERKKLLAIDFLSSPFENELGLSAGGQRRMDRWLDDQYRFSSNIAHYEEQLRRGYRKLVEYEEKLLTLCRAEEEKWSARECEINRGLKYAIKIYNEGKGLTKAATEERERVAHWKVVASQREKHYLGNLEKYFDNLVNVEKRRLLGEFKEAVFTQVEEKEKQWKDFYEKDAGRARRDRKDIQKLYTARIIEHKRERDKARHELDIIRSQMICKNSLSYDIKDVTGAVTSSMELGSSMLLERVPTPAQPFQPSWKRKLTPDGEVLFDNSSPPCHRPYLPLHPELTPLLPPIDEEKERIVPLTERETQLFSLFFDPEVEEIPKVSRLSTGEILSSIVERAHRARLLEKGVNETPIPQLHGRGDSPSSAKTDSIKDGNDNSFELKDPNKWGKEVGKDQRKGDSSNPTDTMSDKEFQELAKTYRTGSEKITLRLTPKIPPLSDGVASLTHGRCYQFHLPCHSLRQEKTEISPLCTSPSLPNSDSLKFTSHSIDNVKGKLFPKGGAETPLQQFPVTSSIPKVLQPLESRYNSLSVEEGEDPLFTALPKLLAIKEGGYGKDARNKIGNFVEFYSSVSPAELFQKQMEVAIDRKVIPPLPPLWSSNPPLVREVISIPLPPGVVRDLANLPIGKRDLHAVERLRDRLLEHLRLTREEISCLSLDQFFDYLYILKRGFGIQDLYTNLSLPKSESNLVRAIWLYWGALNTSWPRDAKSSSSLCAYIRFLYPPSPSPTFLEKYLNFCFPFPFEKSEEKDSEIQSEIQEDESYPEDQESAWDWNFVKSYRPPGSTSPISPRSLAPPDSFRSFPNHFRPKTVKPVSPWVNASDEESSYGSDESSLDNFLPQTPSYPSSAESELGELDLSNVLSSFLRLLRGTPCFEGFVHLIQGSISPRVFFYLLEREGNIYLQAFLHVLDLMQQEEAETLPKCKVNSSVLELSSPDIKNIGAAATHLTPHSPVLSTGKFPVDAPTASLLDQNPLSALLYDFRLKADPDDFRPLGGAPRRSSASSSQQSDRGVETPLSAKQPVHESSQGLPTPDQQRGEIFPASPRGEIFPASVPSTMSQPKSFVIGDEWEVDSGEFTYHFSQLKEVIRCIQDDLGSELNNPPLLSIQKNGTVTGAIKESFCYGRNKLTEVGVEKNSFSILEEVGIQENSVHPWSRAPEIDPEGEFNDVPTEWWDSFEGETWLDVLLRLLSWKSLFSWKK